MHQAVDAVAVLGAELDELDEAGANEGVGVAAALQIIIRG